MTKTTYKLKRYVLNIFDINVLAFLSSTGREFDRIEAATVK
jgi:hypothetical protein